MNFPLNDLHDRPEKPRHTGITMILDKGLSCRQTEDFAETSAEYADLVKLGFGTALLFPKLELKLKILKEAGLQPFWGGTLFEAFLLRNQFDEFRRTLNRYNLEYVEVSDGSLHLPLEEKCRYIRDLSQDFKVLSEVGSKDASLIFSDNEWISRMKAELAAGSQKVIAEAREGGNSGIFKEDGNVIPGLTEKITSVISQDQIIWETPRKSQQAWFINQFGSDVNLGNILPNDALPLEALRLGLRADTFPKSAGQLRVRHGK